MFTQQNSQSSGVVCARFLYAFFATAMLCATFILAGCEDDPGSVPENQDPRSPGSAAASFNSSGLGIMPGSISIDASISGSVQFEALNGSPPYSWRVSRSDLGTINNAGLYTSKPIAGNNTITVTDSRNISVQATAFQSASGAPPATDLSIIPDDLVFDTEEQYTIQFQASGGSPPYQWFVSSSDLGDIERNTGKYTTKNIITGVNIITVRDSGGLVATARVTTRN